MHGDIAATIQITKGIKQLLSSFSYTCPYLHPAHPSSVSCILAVPRFSCQRLGHRCAFSELSVDSNDAVSQFLLLRQVHVFCVKASKGPRLAVVQVCAQLRSAWNSANIATTNTTECEPKNFILISLPTDLSPVFDKRLSKICLPLRSLVTRLNERERQLSAANRHRRNLQRSRTRDDGNESATTVFRLPMSFSALLPLNHLRRKFLSYKLKRNEVLVATKKNGAAPHLSSQNVALLDCARQLWSFIRAYKT